MTKTIAAPIARKPKPASLAARPKSTPPVRKAAPRAKPLAKPRPVVKLPSAAMIRSLSPPQVTEIPSSPPPPAASAETSAQTPPPSDTEPPRPKPTYQEAILWLSHRATQGNAHCMRGLIDSLDTHPQVWRAIGDVGAHVERTWIQLIAGDQVLQQESVRRTLNELKQSIAGEQPTALEKLQIDMIGVTWLAHSHAELTAGGNGPGQQEQYYLKAPNPRSGDLLMP